MTTFRVPEFVAAYAVTRFSKNPVALKFQAWDPGIEWLERFHCSMERELGVSLTTLFSGAARETVKAWEHADTEAMIRELAKVVDRVEARNDALCQEFEARPWIQRWARSWRGERPRQLDRHEVACVLAGWCASIADTLRTALPEQRRFLDVQESLVPAAANAAAVSKALLQRYSC